MADMSKVLSVAKAEVGYLEKKSNSNLDSKTANAGQNNYTKYWRDMNATGYQGQPWCNCFVNWVFTQAYGETEAKKLLCTSGGWSYYTPTSAGYFKAKNQWYTSKPKAGDVIYFKNDSGICHIGLVYKVDSTTVYTYEGNTSGGSTVVANGGGVAAKSYPLGYARIAGYGRPAYDNATTTTEKATTAKKTTSSVPKLASSNPVLKKGSNGAQVTLLQKDLNYVMKSGLTADGDFGAKTDTALKAFQKKYKLTADGQYGSKSEAKMKTLLK